MNQEILKKAMEAKEECLILQGKITKIQHDAELDTDVVTVDTGDMVVSIKREDFDIRNRDESFVKYIGQGIKFVLVDVDEEKEVLWGSRKIVKEYERDTLIEKLENGEEFDAKIVHLLKFGAYLNILGTTVVLKNGNFAEDYTTVADEHKVGDIIKVKLLRVTSTKKILVQAVEKYCGNTDIDISQFQQGQVVFGKIKDIKTWGCYVGVAKNLDALAPVPELETEVSEGTSVALKITKVDLEKNRIRGKILQVITPDSEQENMD